MMRRFSFRRSRVTRRSLFSVLALLLVAGCSSEPAAEQSEGEPPEATQTQRQRDSVIAESGLPGARGVGSAMRAADTAAARNARIDSLAMEP